MGDPWGLSWGVLVEGLFEKGKQTPKALSSGQPQRQLRRQQEQGARALFPEGTEKIADGGARRHPRNAVQKTAHPAEGWQRICCPGGLWHPLPGCRRGTASRGYRFAQPPYRCPEVINRLRAERVPQLKPSRLLITSPPAKTLGSRRMNSTSIPKQEY